MEETLRMVDLTALQHSIVGEPGKETRKYWIDSVCAAAQH